MKIMTKKSILVMAICCLYNCSFSQSFFLKTKNGGPNGFNYTSHKINAKANTKIVCRKAGYEKCPSKSGKPAEQPAIDFAINLSSINKQLLFNKLSK